MNNQIRKLLKVGDTVYSARGGVEMTVKEIDNTGFYTEEDYFFFDEVRKLYFLTKYGYWHWNAMKDNQDRKEKENESY